MAVKISSISARRALESLGKNLKTARTKRRISVKSFADRIGVSEKTVSRLEKGDDGVGIGTLAMACLVLGEIGLISDFLDPGTDDTGLLLEREALPKRIDGARNPKQKEAKNEGSNTSTDIDDNGVGF